MIRLPRNLIRLLRALLRKFVSCSFDARQPLHLSATSQGLHMRAGLPDVLVEFFQEGDFGQGDVVLRAELLKDWEGGRVQSVTLTTFSSTKAQAEWIIDGIPEIKDWEPPTVDPQFPDSPGAFRVLPDTFLDALKQAVACCSKDFVRFATNCVQLDGSRGRIVATDGKQMLSLSGWEFPWEGSVLLPALKVFAGNDLGKEPIEIGKSDKHLTLRTGPWTLHFPIDADRRFPNVDQVIPRREQQTTTLILDKADGEFLTRMLPRLPGTEQDLGGITLDLGEQIVVRAKAENVAEAVEVVLPRSRVEGKPLAIAMSRHMLARAIELGFERLYLNSADSAILAQDEQRVYLWISIAPALVVPAQENVRRIAPPLNVATGSGPVTRNRIKTLSTPNSNGHSSQDERNGKSSNGNGVLAPATYARNWSGHAVGATHSKKKQTRARSSNGLGSVLEESVKLRTQARELVSGLNELIRTVKQQRKNNRLVQTTLTSLKQLKGLVV